MKKIITVLLSVLLIGAALCPGGAFAAGTPSFEVSSPSVKAGENFDVTISIKNNTGIASAKLSVAFDTDLALQKVSYGEKFGSKALPPEKLDSPAILNWISPFEEIKSDAVFATLSFSASKTAKNGEHKISVIYDPDDVFNISEENVDFKVNGGVVTVSGGAEEKQSSSSKASSSSEESTSASSAATSSKTTTKSKTQDEKAAPQASQGYDDGNGDYVGSPVELEFVDEDGNPISLEAEETTGVKKNNTPIWVLSSLAVLIIVAVVVVVIVKKKAVKKPIE